MDLKKVIFALFATLVVFASCGGKVQDKQVAVIASEDVAQQYLINPDSCLSVSILNDAEDKVVMSAEDGKIVLAYLNSGVYNEERNDSGIQFKMVSPDYTFLISYKTGEESMVQYWVESALILMDAKWYNPISAANIKDTLEKYSK